MTWLPFFIGRDSGKNCNNLGHLDTKVEFSLKIPTIDVLILNFPHIGVQPAAEIIRKWSDCPLPI